MSKSPLSVIVLAYNEEENLPDCLASISFADEIIVIDSDSTDKTAKIAKEYGATVYQRNLNNDYAAQRNFAISKASHEWILMLDSDERVSADLAHEIQVCVEVNKDFCYQLSRENHFKGGVCRHGTLRPDRVERLFKKEGSFYEGIIHERLHSPYPKKILKGKLIHFPYKSWSVHLQKMDKYTTLIAQKYFEKGKQCNFLRDVVIKPLWAFLNMYILRLGFLDGKLGFEFCVLHYTYTLEKYLKLNSLNKHQGRI